MVRPFRLIFIPKWHWRNGRRSGVGRISRVLSLLRAAIIHLGQQSLTDSSNLPGSDAGHTKEPYLVLLRVEFTVPQTVASCAVRSYRTLSPLPALARLGGLLSAALVVGSRRPGVTWHPALWSPDFPPLVYTSSDCPGQLRRGLYALFPPLTTALLIRPANCWIYLRSSRLQLYLESPETHLWR